MNPRNRLALTALAFALLAAAAPASACIPPIAMIFFDAGSAALNDVHKEILRTMILVPFRDRPGMRYAIEGQADRAGAHDYNLGLSRPRAEAVRDHLLAAGFGPQSIDPLQAYGETRPAIETPDAAPTRGTAGPRSCSTIRRTRSAAASNENGPPPTPFPGPR